jgi:uncharacterized protein YndB with AHSA1/START domain
MTDKTDRTDRTAVVRVTHRFAAAPERVFDAWLDADKMRAWMRGPAMHDEILKATIDARVGGRFEYTVRRDGQVIEHYGVYREIDRPRRLAFTFEVKGMEGDVPSLVTLDFAAADEGTEVTLVHTGVLKDYAERTQGGWTKILEAHAHGLGG